MALLLIGLGPSPQLEDLTRRAERALHRADRVLLDTYTGSGAEARQRALSALCAAPVVATGPLDQAARARLIEEARGADIALAVAGDPLFATPHAHLAAEARARGVQVEVVPGLCATTAAASLAHADGARLVTVCVQDPAHLTPHEQRALARACGDGCGAVVLAVGREEELSAEAWDALAAELGATYALLTRTVTIDGGGIALLVLRATC